MEEHEHRWPDMGHHPQLERPPALMDFLEAHALRCGPGGRQRLPDVHALPARAA